MIYSPPPEYAPVQTHCHLGRERDKRVPAALRYVLRPPLPQVRRRRPLYRVVGQQPKQLGHLHGAQHQLPRRSGALPTPANESHQERLKPSFFKPI